MRSHGPRSGVGLALLASLLLLSVATPWSAPARAAEDNEAPKASVPDAPQVEDTDKPKDKSLLAHQPADTAKKSQAGDEAFYQKLRSRYRIVIEGAPGAPERTAAAPGS